MTKTALFCILIAFSDLAHAADRWKMQYFYDEERSTLTINDLKFPTAKRGFACGFITDGKKNRPTSLFTDDGGAHWQLIPTQETGDSLFFLNENAGWMVSEKNVWQTADGGRTWRKVSAPKEIDRLYFLDQEHGFGVGAKKSVFETSDGGKRWNRVAAADEPKTKPEYTQYNWIDFANATDGMIAGSSRPPRQNDSETPDWLDPEKAAQQREWPHLTLMLDTRDGGKTWKPSTSSLFGQITRFRLSPNGRGLALIEFLNAFEYPSEVYVLNWRNGKSDRVFREKNEAISDVAVSPSGTGYLAGVQIVGRLASRPIPGKVRVLRSPDWQNWTQDEVDYRATARYTLLAVADDQNAWIATDTGMILKLSSE